jgi:hypothetical protein
MLIELITPLMLATSPMILNVEPSTYNHNQQVSASVYGGPLSVTFSGTQTFGGNGRPMDSDSD